MKRIGKHIMSGFKRRTSRIVGGMAFFIFLLYPSFLSGQLREVSLSACRDSAYANYPLIRKYNLIRESTHYKLSNLKKQYLPQASFGAQATLQSEVTTIPVKLPGLDIPELSKDQYRTQLEIDQLIYDGGRIRTSKLITAQQGEVEAKEWEVNMYPIYERVDELYFGILLLREQLSLNRILQDDLQRNQEYIRSGVTYGVATETDVDEVSVALLDARQQEIVLKSDIVRFCQMLSLLTGLNLDGQTAFMRPSGVIPGQWHNRRPELGLLDAGRQLTEIRYKQLRATNMPVLSAFVQGIYGRPGLNMLRNAFDFGWLAGIRLSYSFGNLYSLKNNRALLQNELSRLRNEREVFLFNTNLQLASEQQALKRVFELMRQDDEIIRLRRNIVRASEAKLQNGTILINDLLRDISTENRAMQQKSIHEIESLQIIWKMKQLINHE